MKNFTKFLSLVALLFCTSNLFADSFTVSNNPAIPAQFTDLQVAIDQANDGDTLYISNSSTIYGSVHLGKQLALIGEGYDPTTVYNGSAVTNNNNISTLYLTEITADGTDSDGSVIIGLGISTINNLSSSIIVNGITHIPNPDVANVYISDSKFSIYNFVNDSFWTIVHSEIGSINDCSFINSNISNCLVVGTIQDIQDAGTTFDHCIFRSSISTNFNFVTNITIINSILFDDHTSNFYSNGLVTFQNNIIDTTAGIADNFNQSTPASENNFNFSSPSVVFVDYTNGDYNLLPDSPAIGAGVGGVDIGIYGGNNPFPENAGAPPTPQFNIFEIVNPNVGQDCEIKFNSEATINN